MALTLENLLTVAQLHWQAR